MSDAMSFRNRDGELVDIPTISATEFEDEFHAAVERATQVGAVAITEHNTPKAVLLSYAEFEALTGSNTPLLDELSEQFGTLLGQLQTSAARSGASDAYDATPERMGRAAVDAARRRRQ